MPQHRRNTRWWLWTATAFFALYVGNVLLGKLAAMQGVLKGWHASNVYEALFLFAAVIAFVIAAIQRERQEVADVHGDPGARTTNSFGGNDGEE